MQARTCGDALLVDACAVLLHRTGTRTRGALAAANAGAHILWASVVHALALPVRPCKVAAAGRLSAMQRARMLVRARGGLL